MSTATENAREAVDAQRYQRALALAAIAQAEAAEKQAEALVALASVLKEISGVGDKSLNVYLIDSTI